MNAYTFAHPFAIRTNQYANQKLQKRVQANAHNRARTGTDWTQHHFEQTEGYAYNSTYPKGAGSCSKDSFVVNGSLVFQIKFCGKNPALRVAANRYA